MGALKSKSKIKITTKQNTKDKNSVIDVVLLNFSKCEMIISFWWRESVCYNDKYDLIHIARIIYNHFDVLRELNVLCAYHETLVSNGFPCFPNGGWIIDTNGKIYYIRSKYGIIKFAYLFLNEHDRKYEPFLPFIQKYKLDQLGYYFKEKPQSLNKKQLTKLISLLIKLQSCTGVAVHRHINVAESYHYALKHNGYKMAKLYDVNVQLTNQNQTKQWLKKQDILMEELLNFLTNNLQLEISITDKQIQESTKQNTAYKNKNKNNVMLSWTIRTEQ
eukprot:19865_1